MRVKSLLLLGLTACTCAVVLSDRSSAQDPSGSATSAATAISVDAERVRLGFELAPVKLTLHRQDPNLVGLGSYLVNSLGQCNDCHTFPSFTPGHDPTQGQPEQINAAGYLAGGLDFGGGVVSRNLTPDAHGLPAGLTYVQFVQALRTGNDPQNPGTLLQVMPWQYIGKMSNADLAAIYEYLRSIPSLPSPANTPPNP